MENQQLLAQDEVLGYEVFRERKTERTQPSRYRRRTNITES